jgi:hypothetical protein
MRLVLGICACIILTGGLLLALEPTDNRLEKVPITEPTVVAITPEVEMTIEAPTPPSTEEPSAKEAVPEPMAAVVEVVEIEPPDRVRIERIDSRSVRLDDRFILRGNGTERDPYTISWELLASARETIDAAKQALVPPPHIELLDGAWVRLDGYYSSPLADEVVSEVLLTLNRWDGCCIGLPPSPFDCMETDLRTPINMRSQHLVRFGSVTGRMKVQPFAIGTWLMGLYLLEDATIEMGSM